jgi:2,3-bisphosphoglycerate-dependent phosphoglycerate mutase
MAARPARPAGPGASASAGAAVARVGRFLGDLPLRWNGHRVLVIGHVATRWGLDHFISGVPLEDLAEQDFAWQPGWEYRVS